MSVYVIHILALLTLSVPTLSAAFTVNVLTALKATLPLCAQVGLCVLCTLLSLSAI